MTFEYEGSYSVEDIRESLALCDVRIDELDEQALNLALCAWKSGFEQGARYIQDQWDMAEDLRMESEAGWDW